MAERITLTSLPLGVDFSSEIQQVVGSPTYFFNIHEDKSISSDCMMPTCPLRVPYHTKQPHE